MLSEELGLGHRACGQTDPFPCFPLKYPRLQMLLREGTKFTDHKANYKNRFT